MIFGATGRLGSALVRECGRLGWPTKTISRAETVLAESIIKIANGQNRVELIFAGGLTDPNASPELLLESNLHFVTRIIDQLPSNRVRCLTVGSVMEAFPRLASENPYLASKFRLSEWVRAKASADQADLTHLRLHTLYGAEPQPHMFLGQIAHTLRDRKKFQMSAGAQFREFHHFDDVAASILALIQRRAENAGVAPLSAVMDLSSGNAIRLSEMACRIFQAFQCEDLLHIGKLSTPEGENLEQVFQRSPEWLIGKSREPITGVIAWLREWLARNSA